MERLVWRTEHNFVRFDKLCSVCTFFVRLLVYTVFIYKEFFYDHFYLKRSSLNYSECPNTGRPVWQTGRKNVQLSNVCFISFVIYV